MILIVITIYFEKWKMVEVASEFLLQVKEFWRFCVVSW